MHIYTYIFIYVYVYVYVCVYIYIHIWPHILGVLRPRLGLGAAQDVLLLSVPLAAGVAAERLVAAGACAKPDGPPEKATRMWCRVILRISLKILAAKAKGGIILPRLGLEMVAVSRERPGTARCVPAARVGHIHRTSHGQFWQSSKIRRCAHSAHVTAMWFSSSSYIHNNRV